MAGETLRIVGGPANGQDLSVQDQLVVGREAGGPGTLGEDPELSRRHARISRSAAGELTIEDLGSTNGTFVNGDRITGSRNLNAGDTISVGSSKLEVAGAAPGAQATVAAPVPTPDVTAQRPVPPPSQTPPVAPPQPIQATAARSAPAFDVREPARTAPPPAGTPQPPGPPRPPASAGGPPSSRRLLPLLFLIVVAGLVAAIVVLAGDDDDDGSANAVAATEAPAEMTFSAMAQGIAAVTPNGGGRGRDEMNIELTFIESPYGITTGSVHKFVDRTQGPPVRIFDSTYTLIADEGNTLTLSAAGTGFVPPNNTTPDPLFSNATEQWTVKEGTGRFAGARGQGYVYGASVQNAAGEGRNADAKVFVGALDLAGD